MLVAVKTDRTPTILSHYAKRFEYRSRVPYEKYIIWKFMAKTFSILPGQYSSKLFVYAKFISVDSTEIQKKKEKTILCEFSISL